MKDVLIVPVTTVLVLEYVRGICETKLMSSLSIFFHEFLETIHDEIKII